MHPKNSSKNQTIDIFHHKFKNIFTKFIIVIIAGLAIFLLANLIVVPIYIYTKNNFSELWANISLFYSFPISLILTLFVVYKIEARSQNKTLSFRQNFKLNRPQISKKDFILKLIKYIGIVIISLIVLNLIMSIIFPSDILDQPQDIGLSTVNNYSLMTMIIAGIGLVLLVPISEELLFRGYFYSQFKIISTSSRLYFIKLLPVFLSSFIFGLSHGQINLFFYTFTLGIILAISFNDTESLYIPITLHAMNNLITFLVVYVIT
jgi:membrane protease YdiL (CAAX protease family)